MSKKDLNKSVAILGQSVYVDGTQIGRDIKVSLPSIVYKTASVPYSGDYEVPIPGNYEAMEFKITLTGYEYSHAGLAAPKWHDIEIRVALMDVDTNGNEVKKQIKHKMKAYPKEIANGDLEVGSNVEKEWSFNVQKYQQYIDGKEQLNLDKINHISRFANTDYNPSIENLL